MCGIVGVVTFSGLAGEIAIKGLHHLEHRGYDSAGVSYMNHQGLIHTLKRQGNIASGLMKALHESGIPADFVRAPVAIAHTRWATHGKPSDANAHPHASCDFAISLVHNGIIENHRELREMLTSRGHAFASQTDTEVLSHLLEDNATRGWTVEQTVRATLNEIEGSYAIALVASRFPGILVAAKKNSQLIIGQVEDGYIVASDHAALIGVSEYVTYPDDGDIIVMTRERLVIRSACGTEKNPIWKPLEWTLEQAQKGGFPYFMLKEIHDQPRSIEDTLAGRLDAKNGRVILPELETVRDKFTGAQNIEIIACGTSYHAGLFASYLFERLTGTITRAMHASEMRYKEAIIGSKSFVLALSQSGETADTIAAVLETQKRGASVCGIVNVMGSSMARLCDTTILNRAGPEISVASTKAFTSQLAVLLLLIIHRMEQRDMDRTRRVALTQALLDLPEQIQHVLDTCSSVAKTIAVKYQGEQNFLYLGRDLNWPTALEGSLKIKEISGVHAEGYPAGEMKHGPIAMVKDGYPCVFVVPKDRLYLKTLSAMEEVRSRHARVIAVTTDDNADLTQHGIANDILFVPKTVEEVQSVLSVVALQLLAYYFAIINGKDPDQPPNLAKSVTVE